MLTLVSYCLSASSKTSLFWTLITSLIYRVYALSSYVSPAGILELFVLIIFPSVYTTVSGYAPNGVDTAACICSAYSCREDKTRLAGLLHPAKIPPAAPAASRHKQNFLNPFIIPHTPQAFYRNQPPNHPHRLFHKDKPKSSDSGEAFFVKHPRRNRHRLFAEISRSQVTR